VGPRPDALKEAIEEAWRVFDIPGPATTGVCEHCCMDPKIEADFLKRKARDLPAKYVREWYFAAFTDDISHNHVAWFLPRVMEMLADGQEVAAVGHEVVFQRLPLTGFPDRWPERQVDAVNRFALALFEVKVWSPKTTGLEDIDSWLCMIGQGGIDISPMLRLLDDLPDDDLVDLLYRNWFIYGRGSIRLDAFWSVEPAKTLAWSWYTSALLLTRMERAAMTGNNKALEVHSVIATARANDGL
jgi:hypothetical protein